MDDLDRLYDHIRMLADLFGMTGKYIYQINALRILLKLNNGLRALGVDYVSDSILISCTVSKVYLRASKTPVLSSSSNTRNMTKLEQILQNFYAKTAQIILQSRLTSQQTKDKRKLNKWFNIVTEDMPQLREELQYWKSAIKQQQEESLPMVIELFLEPTGQEQKKKKKKKIVLETWTLSLRHPLPEFTVDLPNLYKRSLLFFRCLHSLVRLLPCYNLHRRNQMSDECSLSYRLSTELTTTSNTKDEELISFDRLLNTNDRIKAFQFSDVITPLGTLKLDLLYRDYCPFDSPPDLYDIEENFFHQQQEATRPVSSSSTKTYNFQRPISGGTTIERRISAPSISPFKSLSLSSSPQAEIMYPSRSQTPEKKSSEAISLTASSSSNRKKEFSSSFDKYKVNREPKKISRTASDHSSIHLESEEEDDDLKEFMIFIGKKQDLKLFKTQQHDSASSSMMAESSSVSSSSLYGSDSIYKSKKALSHFKNIQEAHSVLSSSISIESNKEQPQPQYPSYISSSSSTKSLNQPAVSSPLHTTESIVQTSLYEQPLSPLKNKRSTSSLLRRPSSVDEDDSLVFKMSELGTTGTMTDESEEKRKGKQPLRKQEEPSSCSKQHQSNL
ncbi:hypothetical protein K501DRAFT_35943 [Backusella circina FSU 941]|nr:hypothetical protein K501DRAFT_35943 [Backusella circina FSU 941]